MSIDKKVSLFIISLAICMGMLITYFFMKQTHSTMNVELVERGKVILKSLTINCEFPILIRDEYEISRLVRGALAQDDVVFCRIEDSDGYVIYEEGTRKGKLIKELSSVVVTRKNSFDDEEEIILSENTGQSEEIGRIYLSVSLERQLRKINNVIRNVAIFVLIIIVSISMISSYVFKKIVTNPISLMVNSTKRIAGGDLEHEVPIMGNDEIGILAASFNRMTRDLSKSLVSKSYIDNILKSMVDSLIVIDSDAKIKTVNEATTKLLGYSEDELLGKQVGMIFKEKKYNFYDFEYQTKKPSECNVERIYVTKFNEEIPMLFSASPMTDSDGVIQGSVLVAQDISKRKWAEEMLIDSEKNLSQIVQGVSLPIFVIDKNHTVIHWNKACEKLTGVSASEIIGTRKQWEPFYYKERPMLCNLLLSSDPREAIDTYYQNKYRKSMLIEGAYEAEGFFPKLGERGRWLSFAAAPIKDISGEIVGVIETLQDITERRIAEEELKRSHEWNNQLLLSMSSAMIGIDALGKITHWNKNAENIFGSSENDVLGRNFTDCNIQWDWDRINECILSCTMENRSTTINDIRYSHPGKYTGFLAITVNQLLSSKREQLGHLLVCDEITERKILESQLAQAQKLESIGQLAAGIAHEINTPAQYVSDNTHFLKGAFSDVQQIFGSCEHLLEAFEADVPVDERIKQIGHMADSIDMKYLEKEIPRAIDESLIGLDRVCTIVRAMKEFAHPGTDDRTSVDINKTIDSVINISRNEWKYVANVKTEYEQALPLVPCLQGELNQVVLNLIVNAAHAIEEVVGDGKDKKGIISIKTRRDGNNIAILISDTGSGIPEKYQSKVFDPFFTTKQVGKGTGQGLHYCHSVITERHSGTIRFETEEGKGTTFIVTLPISCAGSLFPDCPVSQTNNENEECNI